ncbi:MAG: CvpA family protein, partial [Planctomycetota bacterium]
MLYLVALVIIAAAVGLTLNEGIWGNAIRLFVVIMAGLLATSWFEPVARMLEDMMGKGLTYAYDFLALWGLFAIFCLILRLPADMLSRVKVRFMKIVDRVGGIFLGFLVGCVLVSFTLMSLHTAPMAEKFLMGSFDHTQKMLLVGPDRLWLGFVHNVSAGSFAGREFDPEAKFIANYAARRAALEKAIEGG